MPKRYITRLDDRHRDPGGEIRQKRRDTTVGALRKVYGSDFARGYRSDAKLSSILSSTGAGSLNEYLVHSQRAKALSKSNGTSELSNTIISVTSTVFAPALKNLAKK